MIINNVSLVRYKGVMEVEGVLWEERLATPLDIYEQPDMSYVEEATKTISKNLKKGQLVILESTTYPGTTKEIIKPILEESGLSAGKDFFLAYSPEREDPGNKKFSVSRIPKVIGGLTPVCLNVANELYSKIIEKNPSKR